MDGLLGEKLGIVMTESGQERMTTSETLITTTLFFSKIASVKSTLVVRVRGGG
jgi:hypothetical protein